MVEVESIQFVAFTMKTHSYFHFYCEYQFENLHSYTEKLVTLGYPTDISIKLSTLQIDTKALFLTLASKIVIDIENTKRKVALNIFSYPCTDY